MSQLITEISFDKLKSLVYHKRIKTKWTSNSDPVKVKEFVSDNYHFYKDYKAKLICTPCFLLSIESKFYQQSETEFIIESNHGRTELTIISEIPKCPQCNKPYQKASKRWECIHGNDKMVQKFRRK